MADATENLLLNVTYAPIVAAGDEFLLTLPRSQGTVEVVTMAGATPPAASLVGHVLGPANREGMSRTLLGPGTVYARAPGAAVLVTLTHWTPE